MCTAANVSKSTQNAYEQDQRVPDVEYLNAVAAVGVDKVFILEGLSTPRFSARHFDWDLHREIVCALSEFADEQGVVIPAVKQADLIHLLYDECSLAGEIRVESLARALRLVA
jgi:transcriptional regulator with XRE-family HTH domain